ncbi:RNA polymerase factor sigma-54 [Asaia spathodeae]|uniref:RNA polymerase factor sigma-54 n=1 Tax=Asaia spathodeae TaxID=657016 RepID=UPI002FC33BA1
MARLSLQARQTTGLVMTGALQQAIGLLQLSNQELLAELTMLAESNPLLIVSPPEDDAPSLTESALDLRDGDLPRDLEPETPGLSGETWEDEPLLHHGAYDSEDESHHEPMAPRPTRLDQFLSQIRLRFDTQQEQAIALALIEALDESGRIETPIVQLATSLGTSPDAIEQVRLAMLFFEPVGCFALSLAECLAAQFQARNRYDPSVATLLDHLDWLARGEHDRLRKACALDAQDYAELLQELRACEPRPGSSFSTPEPEAEPDLFITLAPNGPLVSLNPATWPRLTLDDALYRRLLSGREDARHYAQEKQSEATVLLRAVEQRARSLMLICLEIARVQTTYLKEGIAALKPLTLSQIAEKTGLHESTVSRVTASRLVGTPRGVLPLRSFFSTGLGEEGEQTSADAIKARIKQIIGDEAPDSILSDDAITQKLQEAGLAIQRRTVAKYREALGIAGSAQRRRDQKLKAHLAGAATA